MDPVQTNQPLTSIEAFALALVEASSCLTASVLTASEASALPTPRDDEAAPAVE